MKGAPIPRLPIGTLIRILLILGIGMSGLTLVAIAPDWLPQLQHYWAVTHYSLEATLRNLGRFDDRISITIWYISSMVLLAAIGAFSLSVLSRPPGKGNWRTIGLALTLFSADKATGLHHALIHDFLYRWPFDGALDLTLKKRLLLFAAMGILSLVIMLVRSIWEESIKRSKQLWLAATFCFCGSDLGINGLASTILHPDALVSQSILLPFLEQCLDQLGGLFLVWGVLLQLQHQLGDQTL